MVANWLAKGMGRAVLFLQRHDPAPHREAILYACRHDLRYDRQCEAERGRYLMDVMRVGGSTDAFRREILDALAAPAVDEDPEQLMELARLFAQEGDARARRALYRAFERNAEDGSFLGADEIICLDGVEGFLCVAGQLGQHPSERAAGDWEDWLYTLEEQVGKAAVWDAVEQALSRLPGLRELLPAQAQDTDPEEATGRRVRPWRPATYAEVRDLIARMGWRAGGYLWNWGRNAPDEDVAEAARDLLSEDDPERLRAYLRIFRFRAFPLGIARLLALTRSEDGDTVRETMAALANVTHPEVRAMWLQLACRSERSEWAVGLLRSNYIAGDHARVAWLLQRTMECDAYHWLAYTAVELAKAHPGAGTERVLRLVYERTPCTLCRSRAAERLFEMGCLPEWMRRECLWDADSHLRELAAQWGGAA